MVKELPHDSETLYQCEACGFYYRERETAETCERWCREHTSCNIEIIAKAVTPDLGQGNTP